MSDTDTKGPFAGVLIANLAVFIFLTSFPPLGEIHHHWILSALATLFGLQYLLLRLIGRERWAWTPQAETALLSLLAFLLMMGIIRHRSILTCFAQCGIKLAGTAAIAAWAFLLHGSEKRSGFWDPLRSRLVAAGGFGWSLYLALSGFWIAPWALDALFFIFALLLWLGRAQGLFFILSLGIMAASAARTTGSEPFIIFFNLAWTAALLAGGAHRIEAWIERKVPPPALPSPNDPLFMRLARSAFRIILAVVVIGGLGRAMVGSIAMATDPAKRRRHLLAAAPRSPVNDPATLSPLAKRLRGHVVTLAETIGERAAHQPLEQDQAVAYIAKSLDGAGYNASKLTYTSEWMGPLKNGTPFDNVLAVLPGISEEIVVVGAHYDSNSDTPGADDNASGVAVLLETARLMRHQTPPYTIHFVAFGTEEPPAFGTKNMGSSNYARRLKKANAPVKAMIGLEMLGYYNPNPGSQLYPPFMHLLYPSHGDYVSVVANLKSRPELTEFLHRWRKASSFQIEGALLPSVLSSLALSDQLNFWAEGYPALMLSDMAFYRNPHYHQHTDTPDTLDYEKMAQVTRALTAVLGPTRTESNPILLTSNRRRAPFANNDRRRQK